jgi:hypothetical protein
VVKGSGGHPALKIAALNLTFPSAIHATAPMTDKKKIQPLTWCRHSQGERKITVGCSPTAVLQRKATAILNVARVIAPVHISFCRCGVERKRRRIQFA